jgi:transposase
MGHRGGENREQAVLFPVKLDELVDEEAMVRVIDAWVNSLNLLALGFGKAQAARLGRPPYDPADLLKLYLCGYVNGIRSSRALEWECRRNVECMWLLGRLTPDHKTIADFRRYNAAALVAVCAAFVQFARHAGLVGGAVVAIDGSKIGAVASRKAIGKAADLEREQQRLAQEVTHYLERLDATDKQDEQDKPNQGAMRRALQRLQSRQAEVVGEVARLAQGRASLSVQTEPQARAMKALHGAPGYNLQTAVDAQSHLIVHHEVCNDTSDACQLAPMAQGAARALEALPAVVADAGYANGAHLQALQEGGMTGYVAPAHTPNPRGDGTLYDKVVFDYDAKGDQFICPAGKSLKRKQRVSKDKLVLYAAAVQDCASCPQKGKCTNAPQRYVSRHWYEEALQANAARVSTAPQMMRLRRQTVEHPFGTIKHQILRNARLLLRGLQGARAELSLAVMAYNLKRVVNMMGSRNVTQALRV